MADAVLGQIFDWIYGKLAGFFSEFFEMIEQMGLRLGEETRAQRVGVILGPGVNIKRSPLCGRNFEYYSEDPLLAGKCAAALIRGIQSTGVAACVKHFAANSQETLRMTNDSIVDERTLREIYLPENRPRGTGSRRKAAQTP